MHCNKAILRLLAAAAAVIAAVFSSATAQTCNEYIAAIDEYVPAPGQFVNVYPEYEEGDDSEAMAAKCTEAIANNAGGLVSLGSYGGYITFHFDHSIINVAGEYDIYIAGNASRTTLPAYSDTAGSCEPGIVMVARDDNDNGMPDDTWYELSGSADTDSASLVTYGYSITYTYDAMSDVPWSDNQGGSGTVTRNNFHQQEYFPLWLTDEGILTFSGTLLPDNAIDTTGDGTMWVQTFYDYGYVDNRPNSDTLACSFNIDWAVDSDRRHVDLDRIDFVRVYTALNQECGWLGETSTEVCGARDLHPDATANDTTDTIDSTDSTDATGQPHPTARYFPDGRLSAMPVKGLNIIRMSDGTIKKEIRK